MRVKLTRSGKSHMWELPYRTYGLSCEKTVCCWDHRETRRSLADSSLIALCSHTNASQWPIPTGSQRVRDPVVVSYKIQPPEALNMVEPDSIGTEGQTKISSIESGVQTLSFSKQNLMMVYCEFWQPEWDGEVGRASELEKQQTVYSQDWYGQSS